MALTVEELQIVLSCDATTAQKVLDQMNATVKAYTEKFQKYFQTKKGTVSPLDNVAKQVDADAKRIESGNKKLKAATRDTMMLLAKMRSASNKSGGYVPSGDKYVGRGGGMGDPNYFKNSEAFGMTFGGRTPDNGLMTLGVEAWGRLGEAIEKVGNISAAVRMKVSDAARDVKNKAKVYADDVKNYGADSKTAKKSEETFKKAIISADKYTQQLNKIIAKEEEAAQARSMAEAQERAAVLARIAMLRVEEGIRQQKIAQTRAAIQADTAPSRTLAPTSGEVMSGIGASISDSFASLRERASSTFAFLRNEAAESASMMASDFKIAGTIMAAPFKALWFAAKGAITVLKRVGAVAGKVGGSIKKAFSHTLLGKFLKRLGSVLLRMAAMALIRGTINGIKKGLEELAKTSTSSAKAMNQMKAAGGSIKMALGAAVMPIVKALVPWFYRLAQVVTTTANAIAQFFARVTGQDHYTAVTLSDGLDDVSNSAGDAHKKMKSVLADFDELVVISKQSGGGGGGSTGVDSSFSTVADKLAFSELGDKIRQDIENGDWRGVGSAIAGKLNEAINGWDEADSAHTLSEKIKNALDVATGFLEETDWRELGEKVAGFFEEIDWSGIADSLFEGLGAAIGGLGAFLAGLFSGAWQSVKDWFEEYSFDDDGDFIISGFLEGIGNALVDIGTWIKEHIFDPFITGFKKAFGIASPAEEMKGPGEYIGQGILEGIEAPFKAIGTWVQDHIVQPIKDWFADHKPSLDLDFDFPDILPDLSGITDAWNSLVGGKKSLNLEVKTSGNDSKGTLLDKIKKAWDGLTGKTNDNGEANVSLSVTNGIPDGLNQDVKDLTSSWGGLAKDGKKSISLSAKQTGDKPSVFEAIASAWDALGLGGEKSVNVSGSVQDNLTTLLNDVKTAWTGIIGGKKTLTTEHGGAEPSLFERIQAVWDGIPSGNKTSKLTTDLDNKIDLKSGSIADKLKSLWSAIFDKDVKLTPSINPNSSKAVTVLEWWKSLTNKDVTFTATLKDKVKSAWNTAINSINSWTGLRIPTLASGGIAYGPTMGLMGEYAGARSNPEVIAPLSTLVDLLSKAGAAPGGSASQEQNDLLREQNRLLRQIAQKELTISPSVQLGQVISRSQKLYART